MSFVFCCGCCLCYYTHSTYTQQKQLRKKHDENSIENDSKINNKYTIPQKLNVIISSNNYSVNNINTSKQIVKQKGIYMPSIMKLLVCIGNGLNDINKREKVFSNLLKDVIDIFNPLQIQNVININNTDPFAKMIQFPIESDTENNNILNLHIIFVHC